MLIETADKGGWLQSMGDLCFLYTVSVEVEKSQGTGGQPGALRQPCGVLAPIYYKENTPKSCAPCKGKEGMREAQSGAREDSVCMGEIKFTTVSRTGAQIQKINWFI